MQNQERSCKSLGKWLGSLMEAEEVIGEIDRGSRSQIPMSVSFIVQMLNLSQIQLSENPEENTTPSPELMFVKLSLRFPEALNKTVHVLYVSH